MRKQLLLTLVWIGSIAGAYLFGRLQGPPPAQQDSVHRESSAQLSNPAAVDGALSGVTAEQLLRASDWQALAAQVKSDGNLEAFLASAQALAEEGKAEDAIEMLDAYLLLDHSHRVLFAYSDLLMMTGQLLPALEPLFQILDYPETPAIAQRAWRRLEVIVNAYEQQLINTDDLTGLVVLFSQLAQRQPAYDRFRFKLARWSLRSGELEAAEALARELGSNGVSDAEREALEREIALAGSSLPFLREGPGYFAEVQIPAQRRSGSGTRSVRLLVDTGATTTSLGVELLQRLGARPLDRSVRVNTANGVTQMATYTISGLRIGGLEIADLIVLALPEPPHGADGLLGMDVLDQLPKAVGTP